MSEHSEFEEWHKKEWGHLPGEKLYTELELEQAFNAGMQACAERKDAELAALRGFVNIMKSTKFEMMLNGYAADNFIKKSLFLCNLIDKSGNPTKLLTGE